MPRGRTAKKGRNGPRKKPPLNVVDLGFGIVAANAVTRGLFGTNVRVFLTEGWFNSARTTASDNSWEVTLGEMVTAKNAGIHGTYKSESGQKGMLGVLETNLRHNGWMSAGTLVVLPIAKKMIKKGISPLTRPVNRLLENNQIKGVKF